MKRMTFLLLPLLTLGNAPGATTVSVDITGLRNKTGMIHVCMTAKPSAYPKGCDSDPQRRVATIKASDAGSLVINDVAPGRYAIVLLHDENGNKKMDMKFILPKEGFGFSRDAPLRMGPPSFNATAFDVVAGKPVRMSMKVRYL